MLNWRIDPRMTDGTSLRGVLKTPWTFVETVARLKALSGQDPTDGGDGYKVSVEFVGAFDGRVFTLYDYKGDATIHVGGRDGLNVDRLVDALVDALKTVTPAPYEAVVRYDEHAGTVHRFEP